MLVIDRALENISEHIAKYAVRAGVNEILITAGKKPWLKGHIEAAIKVMSEDVLHPAPGTTFHNALERMDYDSLKDAVCTLNDLDHALHRYFIDIHPRTPRRSLNNRRSIDVWDELSRKHELDSVEDVDHLNHISGHSRKAVPGRHGINCENMQYYSAELAEYRTLPAFENALRRQGGEIDFILNPADLGQIVVQLPHEDATIVVPLAPKWRAYGTGLSLYAHRMIRKYNLKQARVANDIDQLLESKVELLELMRGQFLSKRRKIRDAQRLARIEGHNRCARAGSDASTTVPGSPAHEHGNSALRGNAPSPSNDDVRETATSSQERSRQPGGTFVACRQPRREKKGYRP